VTKRLRVLLVDDHATVRHGLRLLIDSQADMQVVGEASDGATAAVQADALTPDVVIMDISMPGVNGLAATRAIVQLPRRPMVVALTRYNDQAYLQEVLRAGAAGYVLKQSASSELLHAIRAIAAGGQYVDSALTAKITHVLLDREGRKGASAKSPITERETEVLRLIAWGHSNKEIAAQLDLSVKTVEVHKANAMRKLGFGGRIDIVRYAILRGWLQDS